MNQLAQDLTAAIEKKIVILRAMSNARLTFALKIAREWPGATPALLDRVRLAAILHDVGKIEIKDSVLLKRAALDAPEWRHMQEHPSLGFEILGQVEGFEEVADGVRFHHERWDGQGYPQRLVGDQIPWIARLIAVADTYDAMVSTRPYRKGMSPRVAYDEILRQSGTQFDPSVVEVFARAFFQSNCSHISQVHKV